MRERRSYSIPSILKLKRKICDDLDVLGFIHTSPEGDEFEGFVDVIHQLLPKRIERDVLYRSLRHLAGEELTTQVMKDMAWRLAGNVHRLKALQPVLPWSGIAEPEWVPAQITKTRKWMTRSRKAGRIVTFQILAGTPCPLTTEKFWSTKYARFLSSYLGFTKYTNSKYPFRDIRQMVNFRLYLQIEPGLEEIEFDQIDVPGSFKEWNREWLKIRSRQHDFRCPRNYPLHHPCYLCHVGKDQCAAAVHPHTFVTRYCPQCKRDGYFNPGQAEEICVDCQDYNLVRSEHLVGVHETEAGDVR